MPRLKSIKPRECVHALERLGFTQDTQEGSHLKMRKGPISVAVPMHAKDIPIGTLRGIIRLACVSVGEFLDALNN